MLCLWYREHFDPFDYKLQRFVSDQPLTVVFLEKGLASLEYLSQALIHSEQYRFVALKEIPVLPNNPHRIPWIDIEDLVDLTLDWPNFISCKP